VPIHSCQMTQHMGDDSVRGEKGLSDLRGIAQAHPPLDGVRALAIVLVVAFHVGNEYVPHGAYGVDLFFALSAFLITRLIWAECENQGAFSYRAFYWRRFCRLFPALSLTALVVSPLISMAIGEWTGVLAGIWVSLTYLNGFSTASYFGLPPIPTPFNHLWSLAVEEQFYLIWPLVAVSISAWRKRTAVTLCAVLVLLGLVIQMLSTAILGVAQTYFLPTGHLVALMLGVLVAVLTRNSSGLESNTSVLARPIAGWSAFIVLCVMSILPARVSFPESILIQFIPFAAGAVLVGHAAIGASLLTSLMSSRVAVWTGRRSYGIYLYHTALTHLFRSDVIHLSRALDTILGMVVALALAEVSYRCIEDPIRRRGRRNKWSRPLREMHSVEASVDMRDSSQIGCLDASVQPLNLASDTGSRL
jgi:peptidoglycan/LPS O-acetylase OafA/YrhL